MIRPSPRQASLWAGRTIGLLGGSFNPAHEGHLHISLHAMKALRLDAVWWMVTPQNPLKPTKGMAAMDARLQSATRAAQHPRIFVTDIETALDTRYTADTLKSLKLRYPAARFVWLMGTDNLHQIHLWKDWQDIFQTMPVCVVDRPTDTGRTRDCPATRRFRRALIPQDQAGSLMRLPPPAWTILHTPLNPTSSTAIRARTGGLR